MSKIMVFGVRQNNIGKDKPEEIFFSGQKERNKYCDRHDFCTKFTRTVDTNLLREQDVPVFDTVEQYNTYIDGLRNPTYPKS